ncbi:formin-like protein 9 isoform X1 [Panicum miliaceum]|uniref:Formin-like protein n=1 Tax=Panicum miliaceum TaxID=4540 RepID=A0A3L6RMV8_PANMI|nr:formin-like protein 9 isoform X1 [Panicum miliaceum]
MGLAMKCVLLLLSASLVLLLLNFQVLDGGLHLASNERGGDVGVVVAVTGDVGSGLVSRFRTLMGLDHHRPRHRRHHKSSAAPAPSPAPTPLAHEARASPAQAPAPAPLPHTSHSRAPLKNRGHIAPVRSVARRLGGGGHTRLPEAAIVALAVVGACLLVLGVAIAAVLIRRSRKLQKKPFKLSFHGSRAHRSPCATMKEDYTILKESSERKSLSVFTTPTKSAELIAGDYAAKTNVDLQSDEADSFHSVPCSRSSGGSIEESPLRICDKTVTHPPSSPHMDDSPSGSSYQSLSPDFRSRFSPMTPTSTASDRTDANNTFCHPPEKQDYQETSKTANTSGSTAHPESPRVEQDNSNRFMNSSSGYKSTSNATETTPSKTSTSFSAPNEKINLDSKETSRSSAEGAESKPSSATNVQVGKDGLPLPRLKPLHWDKVRAAPNRSMVWNDIQSSSFEFEFDEQMIKSLFAYNFQGPAKNEDATNKIPSTSKHVIEHHKLQNTTILLKTLNASTEQVCSSITEGTGLSVQQLEALVKMKPSEEEDKKLMDYDGDINMLDPAENFVKVLLTIPMAFSRIEAMLYKETFDDEVAHLRMSFTLIKGACSELRSSKLFLRLLEAVLKTGNRMNVGTIRGGASAFRLDALLKLSDIRGADGKTTLLHFVVQEMVRSQGLKASDKIGGTPGPCNATPTGREEYLEMATEFVSELSNELANVKKVASIDLDTLKSSISNLSQGLTQLSRLIEKDLTCNDRNQNFLHCMKLFQTHAENTMQELKDAEAEVLQQVRELTEYYHGEVGKNESNFLHIFVIMRDFLGLLDRVCREMRGSKHIQHPNIVLPLSLLNILTT